MSVGKADHVTGFEPSSARSPSNHFVAMGTVLKLGTSARHLHCTEIGDRSCIPNSPRDIEPRSRHRHCNQAGDRSSPEGLCPRAQDTPRRAEGMRPTAKTLHPRVETEPLCLSTGGNHPTYCTSLRATGQTPHQRTGQGRRHGRKTPGRKTNSTARGKVPSRSHPRRRSPRRRCHTVCAESDLLETGG